MKSNSVYRYIKHRGSRQELLLLNCWIIYTLFRKNAAIQIQSTKTNTQTHTRDGNRTQQWRFGFCSVRSLLGFGFGSSSADSQFGFGSGSQKFMSFGVFNLRIFLKMNFGHISTCKKLAALKKSNPTRVIKNKPITQIVQHANDKKCDCHSLKYQNQFTAYTA